MSQPLAAGEPHSVAQAAETVGDAIAVVALNFEDAFFESAAAAAEALEFLGAGFKSCALFGQAADDGHGFAAALGGLVKNPNDTIVG